MRTAREPSSCVAIVPGLREAEADDWLLPAARPAPVQLSRLGLWLTGWMPSLSGPAAAKKTKAWDAIWDNYLSIVTDLKVPEGDDDDTL